VRKKVGQARLLDANDVAVLVLVGQVVQMNNAGNRRRHKPRKSKKTVDHITETVQEEIPVVRFAVLKVVVGVVDQVPRDAVVKVKKEQTPTLPGPQP